MWRLNLLGACTAQGAPKERSDLCLRWNES
jgi:hypothetical protein